MSLYQLCEVSNCMIPIWLVGKLRLRVVKLGSDGAGFKPKASSHPTQVQDLHGLILNLQGWSRRKRRAHWVALGNSWGHGTWGGGTESTLASKTHPTLSTQAAGSPPSNPC